MSRDRPPSDGEGQQARAATPPGKGARSDRAAAIRVAIADDHAMVREGLTSMLRSHRFEVVGEAATGRQSVDLAQREKPDVLLMDVRMPDMDGLTALPLVKATSPQTAVIIVTTYEDVSYLMRAIAAGAAGYLLKGIGREELGHAIEAVATGESIIDPSMMRAVVQEAVGQSRQAPHVPLSDREIEVLGLVARGMTNPEIGQRLFITEGTVRAHLHNILKKLDVSDRTQAAVWAARNGLVT